MIATMVVSILSILLFSFVTLAVLLGSAACASLDDANGSVNGTANGTAKVDPEVDEWCNHIYIVNFLSFGVFVSAIVVSVMTCCTVCCGKLDGGGGDDSG